MLSKSHPIILFIDRFGFSVYQDTLPNIPKFNFTSDLISNLDVVNRGQFVSLISTFIQINKIIGSSLAVILSDNVIYAKDLVRSVPKPIQTQGLKAGVNSDKGHDEAEVQSFLEDVPFEEILAKVIKTGDVNKIVAANKDLVMDVADAFRTKGSTVETIVPAFMYGQSANFTAGLTPDNIRVVLGNAEILRLGNLLTDQEKMIAPQGLESELRDSPAEVKQESANNNGAKKPQNHRQYILIGIFIILLIILGIVYFAMGTSQVQPVKTVKKSTSIVNNPTISPIKPISTPDSELALKQVATTTVPTDLKIISVTISHSIQSEGITTNLRESLLKMGFQNVADEISEISIPEKSSVIFSQNIQAEVRNNIISEIRKLLPEISILESQDSSFTINIIVGKS